VADRHGRDESVSKSICAGLDHAYRLAGLLLGSGADAEDAVQEACLKAWRSAGTLREPEAFAAWFDRILVNTCRDSIRRRTRNRLVGIDGAPETSDGDAFEEVLARDALLRTIDCLDVDERAVVVLHYWADLSLPEVANRLGWRVGTVKSRLHRALSTLRAQRHRQERAAEKRKVAEQ
jgi:RNA polymerase sigma factor (sigma-70 family)